MSASQRLHAAAPKPHQPASTSSTGARRTTTFWDTTGKRIANRNLWISVPSLLCGFAVWLMWGIITVQMANLGFPFSQAQLFTLAAISGLSGATLRIPASFFIRLAGGRNTIFLTTALLMIPALGTGIALQDKNTPLWVFQLHGAAVRHRRRQLRLLDVEHQHVLPEAAAGHRAGHQRRAGQLRRHHDAGRDPAGDDDGGVHVARRRPDDAAQAIGHADRQDPAGHADLHPERRLHLAGAAGAAGVRRLVRHEQPADDLARTSAPRPPRSARSCCSTASRWSRPRIGLYLYLPRPPGSACSTCGSRCR